MAGVRGRARGNDAEDDRGDDGDGKRGDHNGGDLAIRIAEFLELRPKGDDPLVEHFPDHWPFVASTMTFTTR